MLQIRIFTDEFFGIFQGIIYLRWLFLWILVSEWSCSLLIFLYNITKIWTAVYILSFQLQWLIGLSNQQSMFFLQIKLTIKTVLKNGFKSNEQLEFNWNKLMTANNPIQWFCKSSFLTSKVNLIIWQKWWRHNLFLPSAAICDFCKVLNCKCLKQLFFLKFLSCSVLYHFNL